MRPLTEQPVRVGFCLHAMQVAGAEVLVNQIIETLGERIQPFLFCLDDIGQLGKELQSSGVHYDRSKVTYMSSHTVDV